MDIARVEQLVDNLDKACRQFDLWASEQVGAQETFKKQHFRNIEGLNSDIEQLELKEKNVKRAQAELQDRLEHQRQELEDLQSGINRLELRKQNLPEKKETLQDMIGSAIKEIQENKQYYESHSAKKDKKMMEFDSLICLYEKHFGLFFQTENDCINFTFKKVDPANPDKSYTFSLGVRDNFYVVVECNPVVPEFNTLKAEATSRTELTRLVITMRQKFLKLSSVSN